LSQEILNSEDNISIAHGVSFWFQRNFTGSYRELGDLVLDGVTLSPDFFEFRSYRFGINALRKKLLTGKNASMNLTLNEPNILNLQRALFAGEISTAQTTTQFEGRIFEVQLDGTGTYIDFDAIGETGFGAITVVDMFAVTDVTYSTSLLNVDLTLNTDGKAYFDQTDAGVESGDDVYVQYEKDRTGLFKAEIFGSETASVEGAAKLQILNSQGGVAQIWDIASVSLAPNGDMPAPLDAVQTIPITATLQERSGTFGNVYAA
jgi:hypothetical protein